MYQKSPNSLIKHLDFFLWDLLILEVSWWLAIGIRFGIWNPARYELSYLLIVILIAFVHVCLVIFGNAYNGILRRGYLDEFRMVCWHVSVIILALLVVMFFSKNLAGLSRLIVAYTAIISLALLTMERDLWKLFQRWFQRQDPRRLLIVSDEAGAKRVLKHFGETRRDFTVVGIVLLEKEGAFYKNPDKIGGMPVVAHTNTLLGYLTNHSVDELLFSLPLEDTSVTKDLIQRCSMTGVTVHLELQTSLELSGNEYVEELADMPVLTSYLKLITPGQTFLKRLMDIVGSIVGLIFTGILFIFVAPAIYISDGKPIFYKQERVGKNGRTFKLYKFRSMYNNADQMQQELTKENNLDPRMFKMDNDPRILGSGRDGTKHGLGYFIRRSSIDEFPQFWNVLKGEMSLVGTRPPTVQEYSEYESRHKARLAIKPGITGMWQVSGRSDITDFEEVVRLDVEYIQNWSIWLDIKILAKTVGVVISGKGSK